MAFLSAILGILILASIHANCQSAANEETLAFIPATYSRFVRPDATGPPIEVLVSFYITNVALKNHRMEVVMYQRLHWTDARLKHKETSLTFKARDILSKIWSPDLFFPNSVEPSQVINPGFVRVNPDGSVLFSRMTRESLSCPNVNMVGNNLLVSPRFNCSIEIESYGFSTESIVVKPKGDKPIAIYEVTANQTLFRVTNLSVNDRTVTLSSGNYTRLIVRLDFETWMLDVPKSTLMALLETRSRK